MISILGISCYYHDSAAVLLQDGKIVAAAQEERFTRLKHEASFPRKAIKYCLREANISLSQIDYLVYYDKPFLTFERLLESYIATAPRGWRSFVTSMPIWLKEKLNLKWLLRREFLKLEKGLRKKNIPPLLFSRHHLSHAGSAFYPSPFNEAAVLCLDGVGEWATTSVWIGRGKELHPQWEIRFPHSLGLLYSAFTYFTGFKVNSGEYKLMGLAPYGRPLYVDQIRQELIDIKEDGTYRLNMNYFDFATGLRMTNRRFDRLFEGPRRLPAAPITQREMDLASSIQQITNEVVEKLARTIARETGQKNLCLAGGVALNCVANGHLLRQKIFNRIWVQPAAGDAGGALGAAFSVWHQYLGQERKMNEIEREQTDFIDSIKSVHSINSVNSVNLMKPMDFMQGAYLGPQFSEEEIKKNLDQWGAVYKKMDMNAMTEKVAHLLTQGKVVAWYQGRMEFGPRALGNRSILGDPRDPKMQTIMNLKIKFRESFRPFAPAVLAEKAQEVFELADTSPYMLMVSQVRKNWLIEVDKKKLKTTRGFDLVQLQRSKIPAVTHVDDSARVQTVHRETNPLFHELIRKFAEKTNTPLLVNTSFNVRGEPIVCCPLEAYQCWIKTNIDYLSIGPFLLDKKDQKMDDRINNILRAFPPD